MAKKHEELYKDPKEEELELELEAEAEIEKDDDFFMPPEDYSLIKVHAGKQEIYVIPPGIEVLRMFSQLEVSVDWRKAGKHWVFWFSFIWNAIMAFILLVTVGTGSGFVMLFLIPFFLAGMYMLYSSIGFLINKTYINVTGEKISVEHKPIKFLIQRDKHFASEEVKQLYVKKYEIGSQNDQPVYAYSLEMELKNKKTIPLIKQFHSADTARYVEQQIEHFLGIKDRETKEEYMGK
ncbi:MAG: hypothetical protein AAF502_05960 [Bacteroidota bacterium]